MINSNFIKENLAFYGEMFSDMEILSVLLGEKVVSNIIDNGINTLYDLYTLEDKEILKINGITKNTLLKIQSLKILIQKGMCPSKKGKISSPKDIHEFIQDMQNFEQEVLRVICLNTKNQIIKKIDLFKGGINTSVVDTRTVIKEVVKTNAASFIIAHNHPSGDATPSKEDINVTKRIKEAGSIVGVDLLDHIIVGENFISLKEKGYML